MGFAFRTYDDYNGETLEYDECRIIAANAVQKRKIEFCIGRLAAHASLSQISTRKIPILIGKYNEPLWPDGIVGSISHSGKMAIAAVARMDVAAGIGVDIELMPNNISANFIDEVCSVNEAIWANDMPEKRLERAIMVFSAKESIFKTFFPIVHCVLDYKDVELIWQDSSHCFIGKLRKKLNETFDAGYSFMVGCRKIDKYIFTYMTLPSLIKN